MLKTLLDLVRELRDLLAELVRQGQARSRRGLLEDNLVTPEEIRAEIGWGEDRAKAWLRTLPVKRYPGKKTDLYRWGDVLEHLPAKEPPAGELVRLREEDAPPVPGGRKFATR